MAKQLDKSIIDGTIDSKKYAELLKNRSIVDANTLDPSHKSLSSQGKAHSIVDLVDNGKVMQRRIYDSNGNALIDFDTTDHNKPKYHKTYAHNHIWNYSNKRPQGGVKEISDSELNMNKDIIQRGVNYFDDKRF